MIKEGSNALAIECFKDHPGQPLQADPNESRKKGKGGKTVSSYFKGQLDDLMSVLYKTEPHFIRCVVPNTHKKGGEVDPGLFVLRLFFFKFQRNLFTGLIMHQYKCNGVLAGIAICKKGFPNKVFIILSS